MIAHITRITLGREFRPVQSKTLCGFKGQTSIRATKEETIPELEARAKRLLTNSATLCESCTEIQESENGQ